MALNFSSGLDPEGVKLRAAEGLGAVDYFMPGYFVWAKLIEALADMDYDSNSLVRTQRPRAKKRTVVKYTSSAEKRNVVLTVMAASARRVCLLGPPPGGSRPCETRARHMAFIRLSGAGLRCAVRVGRIVVRHEARVVSCVDGNAVSVCARQLTEPYDWRLSVANMERRDGYFTRLKNSVEVSSRLNNQKVMVISHSVSCAASEACTA
jgi:Lecithin:cholesterol acyltransferase